MIQMNNFTTTTKEINGVAIVIYTDENGKDWYESQKEFSDSTLKFTFDNIGNIVSFSWDVSMLAPDGVSVTEIKKSAVPADFFTTGQRWVFDGKTIIPFTYSADELQQQAGKKRDELMSMARKKIVVWQAKLSLGRKLTDEQMTQLNAWLDFTDELETVDLSNPVWPVIP